MVSLHRVLVATDFGPAADRAVSAAGAIASAFGADLTVLHAEVFEMPPYFTRGQMEALERQRRDAAAVAAEHVRASVRALTAHPFSVVVVEGPPADVILSHAGTADLVVMGTHGHRGPRRWWLGSVVERVLRETTRPLLVLHAGDSASPEALFERTQVMTSGEEHGAAVEWVGAVAERFGGRVETESAAQCTPAHVAQATAVAVVLPHEPGDTRVASEVLSVLRSCPRPMVFVPVIVRDETARAAPQSHGTSRAAGAPSVSPNRAERV
jgi:nucleotide-binding universal stress UspA family protein